ncbi:MAG TPA: Ig-like domain-containing protein, partial [Bacteroidota bacterium]|nr:Ig-like domain-containing protein [Bacteroidota bacterium]
MRIRTYIILSLLCVALPAFGGMRHLPFDASELSLTIATPPAPVITSTTPASPSSDGSPIVHGLSDPGATIRIYKNGTCSSPLAASTVADNFGNFSVAVTMNANTSNALTATAAVGGATSPCSDIFFYVHDNIAPNAPLITGTTPASPSNDSSIVVSGTSEANSMITVYLNGNCSGPPATSAFTASGSFNIGVSVPRNATTPISVTATDQAGNPSVCSAPIFYSEDDVVPSAPSFSGTSPPSPANNNHPHILGTAEPHAQVTLYAAAGCSGPPVGSGTANGAGNFDIMVTVGNNTSTTFYGTAVDTAGNPSTCSVNGISYDEDSNLPTGSICGMKFLDVNGNGAYEPGLGETPIEGWTIYAVNPTGDTLWTVTDAGGNYCFTNVTDTLYGVFEQPHAGYIQTGGQPYYLLTMGGVTINNIDFGNFKTGQIYGMKFNDLNGDSVNNAEPGLPDWSICLVTTSIANSSIDYSNAGGVFGMHLDAVPGSPITGSLSGTMSDHRGSYNAGQNLIPIELTTLGLATAAPITIGGDQGTLRIKLRDVRQSGEIQGDGTTPVSSFFDVFAEIEVTTAGPGAGRYITHTAVHLAGVTNSVPFPPGTTFFETNVQLYDQTTDLPAGMLDSLRLVVGAPVTALTPICTLTDSLGKYSFTTLLPGTYNIHETQQAGWLQTTATPPAMTIQTGDSLTGIDFGNRQCERRICVQKFFDENHNQIHDPGEDPMEGVEFVLTGDDTSHHYSGFTDANGMVCFSDIIPDLYALTENVPAGYALSVPKPGLMSFIVSTCLDTTVTWLNTAAFTDSTFRTATAEQWALSPDQKGKRKPVKCKPDKVDFKFNLVWKLDHLKLKFPMYTRGAVRIGKDKNSPTVATWDSLKTVDIVLPGMDTTKVLQIDGRGFKGKLISVNYEWSTAGITVAKGKLPGVKTVDKRDSLKANILRLPMPNLHNIGTDLQLQGVFPLVVGGLTGVNSVIHSKYTDVQKSLVKDVHGIPTFHVDSTRCLDLAKGKPITKQLKTYPPDAFGGNRLFAEVLALKLNIAASQKGKFPAGLDTLIYDYSALEPGHPLNGHSIGEIARQADSILICNTDPKNFGLSPLDYYVVVHRINGAFSSSVMDTVTWSCSKLALKGVKSLKSVPWLFAHPGSIHNVTVSDIPPAPEPSSFVLSQNYPNPFNPTTTIQFELLEPAFVTLKVYNTLGQEVATLLDNQLMEDGTDEVEFDASNMSSGVYFYRLIAQGIGDPDEGTVG